jgi:glycosyltransferase involved in cell wall biosynthesis
VTVRVLMALPDPRVRGGPPSHLFLLRDALIARGLDVRTFTYGGRRHDEGWLTKLGGRALDLARIPALLRRHRPDVLHINSAFDRRALLRDAPFVRLARLLGQTVVIKFHGSDVGCLDDPRWLWRRLTRTVVMGSHLVCVLSQEERRAFEARFPEARITVVKNALDLGRYTGGERFRERWRLPANQPLLLFIARFIPAKGLREVIEALPAIRRRHDAHLLLVGDGPERASAEALARRLELAGHVTFTGYIPEEETVGAYRAATLLLLPTDHQEGMPMVLFHSLACGLPVVCTRIRAAADWLEEGVSARFVPPRDPDALARAVTALLDDPEQRRRMGEAGRELATRFDQAKVAEEFAGLYASVAQRGSALRAVST